MSIALLEAMALGIPLVASSIPGNRRIVGDFKHGRLAPPDDPEGLARVIVEQWADFDRAFHMGRAARQPRRAGILDPDRRPQASGIVLVLGPWSLVIGHWSLARFLGESCGVARLTSGLDLGGRKSSADDRLARSSMYSIYLAPELTLHLE